jgi:hypothetical protein
MSDISLLSSYYQRIVAISDKVNEAVITLRKKSLKSDNRLGGKYKHLRVSQRESSDAGRNVLTLLKEINSIIENHSFRESFLPNYLVQSLMDRVKSDQGFRPAINDLTKILSEDKKLTSKHFSLLDSILSVIDQDRTIVFRKLRSMRA